MLISVDASPDAGIRLIREIPDGELLQIEGQNGIGKTLTTRLLELCTGTQPFIGLEASWLTLREHLNDVSIEVSGLKDDQHLAFHLTPQSWPIKPDLQYADELFGRAKLNGRPIEWSEVPKVLQVHRVGGDQTLGESLANSLARDRATLERFLLLQQNKRKLWGEDLQELLQITAPAVSADYESQRLQVQEATEAEEAAAEAAETAGESTSALETLLSYSQRRQQIEDLAPDLERQIATARTSEEEARGELSDLEISLREAFAAANISSSTLEGITKATALRQKRRGRRDKRVREVRELSDAVGVSTPVDLDEVNALLHELEEQQTLLIESRKELDQAGLLDDLTHEVERNLVEGMAWDLADARLLLTSPRGLTVAQTLDALRRNRDDQDGFQQGRRPEILEKIDAIRHRIEVASNLPKAVHLLAVAEADLAQTETDIEEQLQSWKRGTTRFRELEELRSHAEDRVTEANEARVDAEHQLENLLASGTVEDIQEAAGVLGDQHRFGSLFARGTKAITEALQARREGLEEQTRRHRDARRLLEDRRQTMVRTEQAIALTAETLMNQERFGWLRVAAILDTSADDVGRTLEALKSISNRASHIQRLLTETLNEIQATVAAMDQVESRLRNTGRTNFSSDPAFDLTPSVVRHYERAFSDELSSADISGALFDGSASVTVDLTDMTTSWTEPSGTDRTRPLEAFSSGERAFAYTRVQIDRLSEVESENRVIVLDEFGSFIAKERFDQLQRFLRSHALGTAADSIIVILPARSDLDGRDPDIVGVYPGYNVRTIA